ncbi:MAG: M23 family metallopeptidase [Candidatus Binatia bacterium]
MGPGLGFTLIVRLATVHRQMRAWLGAVAVAVLPWVLAGCSLLGVSQPPIDALRARLLMVPVAGVRPDEVPDGFDASRASGLRRHQALDILAPRGTSVVAADDGVVLALRDNRRGGLTIYATDPDRRFVYYYAHLDRYGAGLRRGARITKGEVLGFVGTTGNADRAEPHLHFQVMIFPDDGRWWHGTPIDPRPYFARAGQASE